MYTISLESVTSVEQMLISLSGAALPDGHFYQGRDKIFLKIGSARSGKKTGAVYEISVFIFFTTGCVNVFCGARVSSLGRPNLV